jgi:GNAT superfamily N-acetyltransferase
MARNGAALKPARFWSGLLGRAGYHRPMQRLSLAAIAPDDLDAVARLWSESWRSTGLAREDDHDVEALRARLTAEPWRILVAWRDGEIVGFVAFDPDRSWLRQLFVAPFSKGGGIGTFLLEAVRREMPDGFWLRTDAGNVVARGFYERRGLRLRGDASHPVSGHPVASYVWP